MNFIERLAAELDRLQSPSSSELLTALRRADCHPDEIGTYVLDPIPGMGYGRNVIYRSSDVEAIVIHLPAGGRTSIHNHGESIGCAQVVEGRLTNVVYRSKGFGMVRETGKTDVRTGFFFAAPYGQIHRLSNDAGERAVSLHLYSPPLRGMRTYRPEEEVSLDFVI